MWFSARILRLADQIAAVSTSLREAVVEKGLDPGRVEVIHNGVSDPPPLSGAQRATYDRELGLSGTVVAAVGRLVPLKAHDRFIEAAKIVLERGAHATFLLVGDGPERTDLEALVAKLGVSASVRLLGERDDARALIDRADLVVFSSDREGHSIAALEALAAGTPVVSTDVSGMRELLDGGAGTIVDSWTPAALADAISALINDSERRRAMGDAGRRLVAERFSAERMRARYAEIYARLAGT
jgi:glycosyltransferase involved in cell wall biosynthesis